MFILVSFYFNSTSLGRKLHIVNIQSQYSDRCLKLTSPRWPLLMNNEAIWISAKMKMYLIRAVIKSLLVFEVVTIECRDDRDHFLELSDSFVEIMGRNFESHMTATTKYKRWVRVILVRFSADQFIQFCS